MSRIARSFARPVYMIPSVVAVVAVLALTLFPWKVDRPGSYHVAFAGVDKDLALQEFGVQRVLDRLGIADAKVEVGDCEASCNLTIKDLRDETEVGKVVSAMLQLSDCELLEVFQDVNVYVNINIPQKKTLTLDENGNVTCEFVNELSKEDLAKIEVVVREAFQFRYEFQFRDASTASGVSGGENEVRFGDMPLDPESDLLSKPGTSNGPISGFQLNQNYPNPFNASTTITFSAPEGGGTATLEVYNIRGQLVKTLVDQNVAAGMHEFTWDATDSRGNRVASGIYLYRLRAGAYVETKEMALLK